MQIANFEKNAGYVRILFTIHTEKVDAKVKFERVFHPFGRVQQLNWEPRLPNIGYNKLIILVVARRAPPTAGSSASTRKFVPLLLPVRARRTNGSRADCARIYPRKIYFPTQKLLFVNISIW